jgi:peptidylprolyl isomerase
MMKGLVASVALLAALAPAAWPQSPAPAPAAAQPSAAEAAADPANWRRVDPEDLLVLTINGGRVVIELATRFAPAHVAQVKAVARAGHYDGVPFHRVIDDFMAQGGEVSAVYMLSKPYPQLAAEFTFRRKPAELPAQWLAETQQAWSGYVAGFPVGQTASDQMAGMTASGDVETWGLHCPGVASMARADDPDSADTQFFLMRQTRASLDRAYTIWGRALSGLDVIRAIKAGPAAQNGAVARPDKLASARIAADLPEADRPVVYVQRTDGPAFLETLAAARAAGATDVCALPPVPAIVESPR